MIKYKLSSFIIVVSFVFFVSCTNDSQFKIEKGRVGELTSTTSMKEVYQIFKQDSIIEQFGEGALGSNYFQDDDKYFIYEKGGKHLLTIIPNESLDSTSTIKSIEIHDARYSTASGITIDSNFSEINANYTIRPESTLQSVTLFLDELNATIAIDKKELGLRSVSTQKVTLEQIPDLARMKSFVIWFN